MSYHIIKVVMITKSKSYGRESSSPLSSTVHFISFIYHSLILAPSREWLMTVTDQIPSTSDLRSAEHFV